MKISLTQGHEASIDDSDEWILEWKWHAQVHKRGGYIYAARGGWKSPRIYLHRFLLDCPKGMTVDHIDGNTLNCCRSNLRIASKQQNIFNQRPQSGCTSIFKGVSWYKRDELWSAHIVINQKKKYLGRFQDERAAAQAYDAEAIKLFGEFARLNFPI